LERSFPWLVFLEEERKEGKERGCTAISGIKMLYGQAEKAWEIWNDKNL